MRLSHCVAEPLCRQSHVPKHVNCVDSRQLGNLHGGSKLATPPYRLTSSLVDNIIMPRRMVALSDTVIRQSVCPSPGYSTLAAWRSCLGYRHAGCLQLAGHQRCADCGPVRACKRCVLPRYLSWLCSDFLSERCSSTC